MTVKVTMISNKIQSLFLLPMPQELQFIVKFKSIRGIDFLDHALYSRCTA